MMDIAFDTLAYARKMESVGFTRAQAEAMAEEQAKLIDERLATKADLAALRTDLTREIEQSRRDTQIAIERLRQEMQVAHDRLRQELQVSNDRLRQEAQASSDLLRRDLEVLRRDLVIRLGGIVIGTVGAALALSTLLGRAHP